MSRTAQLFYPARCLLAEGPVWSDGALWWVDILAGQVHRLAKEDHSVIQFEGMVGAVIPTADGRWLAACQDGLHWVDTDELACPVEADIPNNRFNDAKVAPDGVLWAGTTDIEHRQRGGTLYRIDSRFQTEVALLDVTISNGLAWSRDGQQMYYIDTPTRAVDVLDYDSITGRVSNRRVAFVVPEALGHPDGMTIDSEDNLWIAMWGGGCVVCFDPATGEVLDRVEVPVSRVTSCTFGGQDLGDLYITTASRGATPAEQRTQPEAGSIFVSRPGVTGRSVDRMAI